MKKNKQLLIIGGVAIASLLSGYYLGTGVRPSGMSMNTTMDHSTMTADMHASSTMDHGHITVGEGRANPEVELDATPDSKGGYNIHIITKNFTFTPQDAGKAPVQNTGHAHVLVNGTKIARAYGEWFYVGDDKLVPGLNIITVSLNANEHSLWVAKNGDEIEASAEVEK